MTHKQTAQKRRRRKRNEAWERRGFEGVGREFGLRLDSIKPLPDGTFRLRYTGSATRPSKENARG